MVDTVDVTWEASPFYLHCCFYPCQWEHGYVQYDSQAHNLSSGSNQADRCGSHLFTRTQGVHGTHSITSMFFYGDW